MQASNEKWAEYLTSVREHLPESFEADIMDEGLIEKTGAYIFTMFMEDTTPAMCAARLKKKLGVEDGEL
jgi:hypothetical protein